MEKKKYSKPETSVCQLETSVALLSGSDDSPVPPLSDEAADDSRVISNELPFTDIWGNEF